MKMTGLSHQQQTRLVNLLNQIEVIKFGNYTLKDGTKSKVYIDLRILPNFPTEFQETIEMAAEFFINSSLHDTTDGFIAPPLAGIPLATTLAFRLHKAFYLVRAQSKAYGTKKLVEGDIEKKRLIVVDDVITTGGSKIPFIKTVRAKGGIITSLFVFVNRMPSEKALIHFEQENRVKVHSLLSLDMLVETN